MSFQVSVNSNAWPVIYHGNGPAKENSLWKNILKLHNEQENWKERRPIIEGITVITWSVPEERPLLQESFAKMGIEEELVIIPITKPFNWLDKITKTRDYLQKIDTKYVIGIDSTDVLISTDTDGQKTLWYNIKEVFKKLNCKLVYNAEKLNWPSSSGHGTKIEADGRNGYLIEELIETEKFEEEIYKDYFESKFYRLNSGGFMGYTDYTKTFYEELCRKHVDRIYDEGLNEGFFGGDQGFIRIMQRSCFPDVTIDYSNQIFLTFAGLEDKDIEGVWK